MATMIYEAFTPLIVPAVAAVAVFCVMLMLYRFFQDLL